VQEIWNNIKNIVYQCIGTFFSREILRKKSDFEYYNKEIKRLESKGSKAYDVRKLGVHYLEELKQLSKQVLAAKKSAQGAFLKSIPSTKGKCWPEFYKYVKRRIGNRESIPVIKDCNGRIIIDSIEKTNSLNLFYSSVFTSKGNISNIQGNISSEPFIIDTKIIRKTIATIGKKQVGRVRLFLWRNSKTRWGSHDSMPCATT